MNAWTVVGLVVFAAVAVLFIVDALVEPTPAERVAGLVGIGAGLALGVGLAAPWLPLGLCVVALGLWLAGRRQRAGYGEESARS